jgi:hypothetical protein
MGVFRFVNERLVSRRHEQIQLPNFCPGSIIRVRFSHLCKLMLFKVKVTFQHVHLKKFPAYNPKETLWFIFFLCRHQQNVLSDKEVTFIGICLGIRRKGTFIYIHMHLYSPLSLYKQFLYYNKGVLDSSKKK